MKLPLLYLIENIEVFNASVRSMGAIMYSFAGACNPLISKNILSRGRVCRLGTLPSCLVLVTDNLQLVLRVGLDLLLGKWQRAEFFLGERLGLVLEVFGSRVAG